MQSTKKLDREATAAVARLMDRTELTYILHDIKTAKELCRQDRQPDLMEYFQEEEEIFAAALRNYDT